MPVARTIEIRTDAVIIHGDLNVTDASASPVADYVVLEIGDSPTKRLLHAGGSWAPGGEILEFNWDFGDGLVESYSGNRARFATQHDFAIAGRNRYDVCLAVVDTQGRSKRTHQTIKTKALKLNLASASTQELGDWICCHSDNPVEVRFSVYDADGPVPGALVKVMMLPQPLIQSTNSSGLVHFTFDLSPPGVSVVPETVVRLPEAHDEPNIEPGQVSVSMLVEVTKDGYLRDRRVLYFISC